ncbi:MAG: hypothetical protein M3Y41_20645, partial [Pseudomonadota bacterium]|nr:hypothetical protein [Pseudomonadota bacterium]
MISRHAALLAIPVLLCATPVRASPPTPDQAKAVERQLHDWLQTTLGPAVPVPPRPVRLHADGNAYRLTVPLDPALALTGHLTQHDDGRWLLSDLTLPSPARFTTTLQTPPKDGKPAATVTTTTEISLASQYVRGIFDPSFKTPSTLEQQYGATQIIASNALTRQAMQFGSMDGKTTLTREPGGGFDLASTGTIDHYL